jgi:hypothetical protein
MFMPTTESRDAVERAREIVGRLVEGDSDNPERVARADRYYDGREDDSLAIRAAITALSNSGPVGGEAMREALEEQTQLVDRLLSAVERVEADIGGEPPGAIVPLLGSANDRARAALATPEPSPTSEGLIPENARLAAEKLPKPMRDARLRHIPYSPTSEEQPGIGEQDAVRAQFKAEMDALVRMAEVSPHHDEGSRETARVMRDAAVRSFDALLFSTPPRTRNDEQEAGL